MRVSKNIFIFFFYFMITIVYHDMCSFHKQNDSKIKDYVYEKFGVNAASAYISPHTKVVVSSKYRQVTLTINDQRAQTNNTLELSEEAALYLGINREGIVKCDVQVLIPENPMREYLKTAMFYSPFFAFILGLWWYTA